MKSNIKAEALIQNATLKLAKSTVPDAVSTDQAKRVAELRKRIKKETSFFSRFSLFNGGSKI